MPRTARKQSESGIYHVMLRGIDRQLIFEDTEDYYRFLDIVQECRELCNFKLYAYCLLVFEKMALGITVAEAIADADATYKAKYGDAQFEFNRIGSHVIFGDPNTKLTD